MASIYDLKSRFQNLLRPLTSLLAKMGITPNAITLAALVLSMGVGFYLWRHAATPAAFYILPVFLFIRMALNAIDGMLAREHGMQTRLGGFMNEIGDVVSDTALYMPFAIVPGLPFWSVVLAVFLAFLSEFTGLCGLLGGGSRRYDGPMGKSDRALVFSILALFLATGFEPGLVTDTFIWLINALLGLTILNRIRYSLQEGTNG